MNNPLPPPSPVDTAVIQQLQEVLAARVRHNDASEARLLAAKAEMERADREWLEEYQRLQEAKEQQAARNTRNKNITIASLAIGAPTALAAGATWSLLSPSGTKQAAPTPNAITSIDPLKDQDAFVAAANAATPEVKTQAIQLLNNKITNARNIGNDFAGMAQSPSLYGTAAPTVDTHFLIQLQNFGGKAATKATDTNAAVLRDMLNKTENMQHFKDLAKGDPALSHALATLNNNSPEELNKIVADLSALEYARLKGISGVDFHDHFEKVFNPHGNGTGGVTTMKEAIAKLKGTFQGYGDKFTEQVKTLNQTLTKISPPRTSAASNSQGVLVASTDLEGLVAAAAPPPPNALQQALSAAKDTMQDTFSAVGNTLGSAAKATGKFVQENASALTAASAAVTLVRAHIDVTQQGLDEKATFKERAVAALTTKVSVQEYANTLSQSRYALGLARTVALAAVAITPAAISVAATIGAVQMAQTGAGVAAALTKHQMTKTEQRLSALQAEEGAGRAAEQITKLEARQARLQNRATALDTVANANWEDVSNVAKGTMEHITTAASKTGENFNATFAKAQHVAQSTLEATKSVQSCFGNLMARFGKSQDIAHA
jgi:hypothetical protein